MPIKGIQQFQLRQELGSLEKARHCLRVVKEAGFEGIEINQFMIQKISLAIRLMCRLAGMPLGGSGKINWVNLVKEFDLKVISLHSDLNSILQRTAEVANQAQDFETNYVVITGMRHFDYSKDNQVKELVVNLNTAGEKLAEYNLQLLYHNHNCEFRKLSTGQTAYDYLVKETNPKFVNFEFDSYWAMEAGCDVFSLMEQLGPRMKLYHINDRGTRINGPTNSILKSDSVELGYGNMNLVKMVALAKKNGVDSIILESHQNWVNKSALDSLKLSSEFMNKNI